MSRKQPEGFLAAPRTAKGRGVIVLHPWWGLNDTTKSTCTRLAEEGFAAFAPDLYHGRLATTIAQAETLSSQLDPARAKDDVADAVGFLSEQFGSGHGLTVIGFSLGAYYALQASISEADHVGLVAVFYGTGPGDYARSKAAYLGHFAEVDEYEPPSEVDALESSLRIAGRPVQFHRYPGTGHWFFEPDREQAYNASAATLAWERTLAFLKEPVAGKVG